VSNFIEYPDFDTVFASLADSEAMALVLLSQVADSMSLQSAMFSVDMSFVHAACALTPTQTESAIMQLAKKGIARTDDDGNERFVAILCIISITRKPGGDWLTLDYTMPRLQVSGTEA
jgi:hypothetical protein